MRIVTTAIDGAVILEGERGEAQQLAPELLRAISMQALASNNALGAEPGEALGGANAATRRLV